MRLLHARHPDDHDCLPEGKSGAVGRGGARGSVRQSVPLHRLSKHRRCHDGCCAGDAGRGVLTTRFFGAPIKRNEDKKLLTGQALFIDDVELPDMLHAAFLRSQVAHARIKHIDVSRALKHPGVVAVFTAGDLGAYWKPGPLLVPPPPIRGIVFNQRTQVPLAKDKVRYVGEPLAIVVAENRYIAEDALDDIEVDLETLPAVVDLEHGLGVLSAHVHDDLGSNISAHVRQTKGDYRSAAAKADLVLK